LTAGQKISAARIPMRYSWKNYKRKGQMIFPKDNNVIVENVKGLI